ncbi:MAG: extracellular solute-binding protein [Oscillospiraceae bacterium]|nr:extracellular solute-binding protein [Oscillospiraceae bacterium]MDE7172363.1 extracellular solute-binding protein [Oscillospiraceae bacterium]
MKKGIALLLALALCLGALAGCSQPQSQASDPVTGPSQGADSPDTPKDPVTVTVWHDGDEGIMQTIADQVNAQLADDQITVVFEKKTDMPNQLKLYGSDAANAPDLYFYAHDVLGTFVAMDILAPLSDVIDTSVLADHLSMTVEAGQIGGTQYLLPVYFETLVLLYNKALWEGDIPGTTEELYDYMVAHTDAAAGTYAVVNQHTGAYNVSPFIYGFGGYIIDEDGKPGLNDPKTIEAAEYNRKFGALQADGDYNTVTTLFNEGKAAAIIGGPWLVSGIEAAGIDYGVASLSDIKLPNGNGLAPFSGIQGVGVLKTALADKKDAVAKVLTAMASPEVGVDLANKSGCAPANNKSYDDPQVASNEMIAVIQKTASTARPMPNIPEMNAMWGPAEAMLTAINKNGADPAQAAADAQAAAEQAVADMQ